ncbi:MAG: polysialyltransferase family glycosyltransferase [bacterium]|nr:polysialyltransferase family glycosyltransferase [bacterium]
MPKRILWSANDPGGANAVVPVVAALIERGDEVVGIVTGPAIDIAKQKGFVVQDADKYSEDELKETVARARPDVFLAGTSGSYDSIDKKIFKLLHGVPSVCVLDFWSNYRMRFSAEGEGLEYMPTIVCVMDELARREMLAVGFDDARIRITGNPHTEHFTEGITRDREDPNEIVFISQPLKSDNDPYPFDEFTVVEHLVRTLESLPTRFHLKLRLHPREEAHKFDEFMNERVRMSSAATLEEALSTAGLVVGMYSPVLIQAAAVGKPVISYEPNLIGEDPLVTNRFGLTNKVSTEKELERALKAYVAGEPSATTLDVSTIWPKGAAERILIVIDELIECA